MGIVYVLVNPAFDRYVKVGRTDDLEQRLRKLDNTSVPLPFRCEFAIEVDNDEEVERKVHDAFHDVRVKRSKNNKREFFEISAQRVISALKLTGGREVTPKEDIAESEEDIKALEQAVSKQKSYSFANAQVKNGDILVFARNETITAIVSNAKKKKIKFEGKETSLSGAALTLLHRDGYKWKRANGWAYWMKEGKTLSERVDEFAEVEDEN